MMRSLAALLLVVSPGVEEHEPPRTWGGSCGVNHCAARHYHVVEDGQETMSSEVWLFSGERALTMEWRSWAHLNDSLSGTAHTETVAFPTDYWPTFATWITDEALFVGGVTVGERRTVIEVWHFEEKEPQFQNDVWELPQRQSVVPIYESSAQFSPKVVSAVKNLGDPNSVFVRFAEWNPLYSLELATGRLTVAASPYASGPVTAEFLFDPHRMESWHTTVHPEDGYVYANYPMPLMTKGNRPASFLLDTDRDGKIDKLSTRSHYALSK